MRLFSRIISMMWLGSGLWPTIILFLGTEMFTAFCMMEVRSDTASSMCAGLERGGSIGRHSCILAVKVAQFVLEKSCFMINAGGAGGGGLRDVFARRGKWSDVIDVPKKQSSPKK